MAEPQTNLKVRISAELGDIKAGLAALRGDLAKVKSSAAGAMPDNNAFVSGIRRARNELMGFVGVYLSLRGVKVLAGIADEASMIRGRIKEAKGDYQAILALAQRTRTGLQATTDLYARLERSTRAQRLGQQQLLSLTQSVNQAVKLSFASAASGEAALFQLGQGLGAGALRGEELNSVMEQTPRLAQAIADGLGVPIGKLRELAKEGKLTGATVTKALESQAKVLAAEYARLPVTVSGAFTQIRNALVDYVGEQDAATGASKRFAATLQQIATELPRYLDPVLKAITLLIANIDTLIVFLGVRLAGGAIAAAVIGFTKLIAAITAARNATLTLRVAMLALGGPIGIAIALLAAGLYVLYQRTNQAKVAARQHSEALDANAKLARTDTAAALDNATAKRKQALATLAAAQALLQENRARLRDPATTRGAGGRGADGIQRQGIRNAKEGQAKVDQATKELDDWTRQMVALQLEIQTTAAVGADAVVSTAEETKKAVRGVVDGGALAVDALKRLQEELDRLFEAGGIKIADYYAQRQALELAAIDQQIAQAQAEAKVAKTSEQQGKALTEIIKLQRERADIGPRAAREQLAAEEELNQKLGEVKIRLLEADGKTARARSAQLEEEFRALIVRLQTEGDVAGEALVRKLINVEAGKAQLAEFKAAAETTLSQLRDTETSLSSQAAAGMLGTIEAERQIDVARTASLDKLRQLRESVLAYYEATKDPAVLEYLAQLNGNIGEVASSQQQLLNQGKDVAASALTTFFNDLRTGSKSAGDAFGDMVEGFVEGMAQLATKALATFLVMKAFDTMMPGFSAMFASMNGSKLHRGGVVGNGGTVAANLNPMMFGAAPRYHAGGFAGLKNNEVAAVLERGEEVITANDPRHTRNGGRNGGGGGAGDVYLTVENNGEPMNARTEQSSKGGDTFIKLILDAAEDRVAGSVGRGGKVGKAMQATYALKRQGTSRG